MLFRSIKITLGQLPSEFRGHVGTARIISRSDAVRRAESDLRMRLAALGLNVDWVEGYTAKDFNKTLPAGIPVSPAFSAAARAVTGTSAWLEFHPPKIRPWHRLASRFSSKKLGCTEKDVL